VQSSSGKLLNYRCAINCRVGLVLVGAEAVKENGGVINKLRSH
jgi:translation initiation factor 2B subunit (eIF-2B alpha/beta/delta family)